jgi:PAS domain S-box-containing protein
MHDSDDWLIDGEIGALISEYKRREAYQQFLNDVSRELERLTDIATTMSRLSEKIGVYFGVWRCAFAEIDDEAGEITVTHAWVKEGWIDPIANRTMRISDFISDEFSAIARTGEMMIVRDTNTDPGTESGAYAMRRIRSFLAMPFVREGTWRATLSVADSEPRDWRTDEIELMRELTIRIWMRFERARTEATVRESEARFRTLADAVPQLIWANEATGKAIYFNQRWYDYSGLSHDESVGLGWQVIVHPDDEPASVERWNEALAAGKVFDTEYRLRRADGLYRWFIGRNVPLPDTSDQVVGWFGSATDIEELKQIESARRESEERFRLLVEGARDYAMFLLDSDNCITYWSIGAERLFGWSETEAQGQLGALIFTPEDRERGVPQAEVQKAIEEGSALDRRWHIRKDRSLLFIDGALIRLNNDDGALRGFVKIGRDATVQRHAEEALQRARDELELRVTERTAQLSVANEALRGEIAERRQLEVQREALMERIITAQERERQRIAHELHDTLGQFLSALNMRLSMVQSFEDVPPALRDQLAQLRSLTGQVDREVDRLTMELRPPALEHLGLADALHHYAEEWAATSGVRVDMVVRGFDDTRLPEVVETTTYRIVQEALTNVLKHAQASMVSVLVERRSDELRVIVEDDGVGFEPGQNKGTNGRQMGLIGMMERATLAGGEVTIESSPDAGTTIYLRIPGINP